MSVEIQKRDLLEGEASGIRGRMKGNRAYLKLLREARHLAYNLGNKVESIMGVWVGSESSANGLSRGVDDIRDIRRILSDKILSMEMTIKLQEKRLNEVNSEIERLSQ